MSLLTSLGVKYSSNATRSKPKNALQVAHQVDLWRFRSSSASTSVAHKAPRRAKLVICVSLTDMQGLGGKSNVAEAIKLGVVVRTSNARSSLRQVRLPFKSRTPLTSRRRKCLTEAHPRLLQMSRALVGPCAMFRHCLLPLGGVFPCEVQF